MQKTEDSSETVAPRRRIPRLIWLLFVVAPIALPLLWQYRPLTPAERRLVGTWRVEVPYGWARQYSFFRNRHVEVRDVFIDGDHLFDVPDSMRGGTHATWTCTASSLSCDWKHATFPKTTWGRLQVSINNWMKRPVFKPIETVSISYPDSEHLAIGKAKFERVDGPDAPPRPRK